MNQLTLNFAGYDTPNKNGVYVDCERLAMPPSKSRAAAEIRIAYTAEGWLWGESVEIETEGFGGLPSDGCTAYRRAVPTRTEAVGKACATIRRFCSKKKSKSAAAILVWLDLIKEAS